MNSATRPCAYGSGRSRPPGRRNQAGFALLLCLWAVVIVMLLAAAFDSYASRRVEQARLIRERLQEQLDIYSTRSTVLYLLATQRFTRAGLTTDEAPRAPAANDDANARIEPVGNEIALDGTVYRGIGRARFALQDQSGLIALNSSAQSPLRSLLQTFAADPIEVAVLTESLADYRDADARAREHGAEFDAYAAAGLPGPANANLRSVSELTQVSGWGDWLASHRDFRLQEWLSVSRVAAFNPNVVPESLLAQLPGMDTDQARLFVELRRAKPFASLADLSARAPLQTDRSEGEFRFFPAEALHLAIWPDRAPQAELLRLQLSPLGRHGPWQMSSVYHVPRNPDYEAQDVASFLFGSGSPPAP